MSPTASENKPSKGVVVVVVGGGGGCAMTFLGCSCKARSYSSSLATDQTRVSKELQQ